jgi:hypothetical protein
MIGYSFCCALCANFRAGMLCRFVSVKRTRQRLVIALAVVIIVPLLQVPYDWREDADSVPACIQNERQSACTAVTAARDVLSAEIIVAAQALKTHCFAQIS